MELYERITSVVDKKKKKMMMISLFWCHNTAERQPLSHLSYIYIMGIHSREEAQILSEIGFANE